MRGGIYAGSAEEGSAWGEGAGRRGQVSYATPPLIVLRPWQLSSSLGRGGGGEREDDGEEESAKPPAAALGP